MGKRFFDTEIWLKNKWFRKLKPKFKLFWFYLISNCDSVGVWEEDIELASYAIQYDYDCDEILKVFGHKIKLFSNNEKWWIKDFVNFQYGILQNNPDNKPHTSYINLLKKHELYIDYKKGIYTLKEKEKEKDKEKDKEKEEIPKRRKLIRKIKKKKKRPKKKKIMKKKYGEYKHVLITPQQYKNLLQKWGQRKLDHMIKVLDEGIELKGYKYKNHNLAIQKWARNEKNALGSEPSQYKVVDK